MLEITLFFRTSCTRLDSPAINKYRNHVKKGAEKPTDKEKEKKAGGGGGGGSPGGEANSWDDRKEEEDEETRLSRRDSVKAPVDAARLGETRIHFGSMLFSNLDSTVIARH